MGKINEILKSGIAPGAVCGERPFDPASVFHKAPNGLKELETQPRYKHGPNYSARDISKHFGMPTDFIKQTWSKPLPKAIACFLVAFLFILPAKAVNYITAGETLQDGQTVHAQDLMNLVQNAIIGPGFYYSQPIDNTPLQSDYLVLYSPTLGGLYKATLLNAFLNNPQSITLLPNGTPVYTNQDLFAFYSAAGTNLESITASNLANFFSTYANPSLFPFAYTNIGTGTNTYFLPNWTGTFSGFNTNLPESLWWGTNGIAKQQSLYGLEIAEAADLGTNIALPYNYNYLWYPWTFEGTNTVSPYTNAFGWTTNFPITAAFQTNAQGSNLLTLTLTDSIPILANLQAKTNTSVTLGALYGLFTNINALPAYTQARIQFSGIPETLWITNNAQTTYGLLNITSNSLPAGQLAYAVSVVTNTSQIVIAGLQTNTLFYIVPTATNNEWVHVYSNYVTAVSGVGWLPVLNAGTGTQNKFLYLTNYTSFNADVTQQVNGDQTTRTAVYDIWFRSPSPTPYYYVTGNAIPPVANPSYTVLPSISYDDVLTTNEVRISTFYNSGAGAIQSGLVHVLISPQ